MLLPLRIAEIGVRCAGGDEQRIVFKLPAIIQNDDVPVREHLDDFSKPYLDVALFLEDVAQRDGNVGRGQLRAGDLIKQRLEKMVVAPVYQRNLYVCGLEAAGGPQSGKSASHDDQTMHMLNLPLFCARLLRLDACRFPNLASGRQAVQRCLWRFRQRPGACVDQAKILEKKNPSVARKPSNARPRASTGMRSIS